MDMNINTEWCRVRFDAERSSAVTANILSKLLDANYTVYYIVIS